MAYEVDYYAKLLLPKTPLKKVQAEYLAWLLGTGKYFKLKDRRREIGINSSWTQIQVAESKRLMGFDDFELDARTATNRWVLRYRHRDASDPAVLFQHLVRLNQVGTLLEVEHGIRRSAPRELLKPLARAVRPRVIEDLTDERADVLPKNLNLPPIRLNVGEVELFTSSQLFEPSSVPWVVVSPSEEIEKPLIEPIAFAQWFDGMAGVAVLDSVAASWELTTALKKRGFGDELRCFGGAVRLYDNNRAMQRLPFLMPAQIQGWAETERTARAGYDLSTRLAVRKMPPNYFLAIEEEDHLERTHQLEVVRAEIANGSASVSQLQRQLDLVNQLLGDAGAEIKQLERESADNQESRMALEIERDEALRRVDEIERKAKGDVLRLSTEAERLRSASKALELSPALRGEIALLVAGELSIARALEVAEAIFGERLTVLASAKDSARKASTFQWPEQVGSLLVRLATDYFDELQKGGGDAQAKKIFGDKYAAKESRTLSNQGKELRTFTWNGNAYLMESHLKAGTNKFSDAECFRLHFMWDAELKRIVIGHCGAHLNL